MPKYNYKADALTDFFKGKLSAKELDKIARNDFGSGVATKKELSNFLSNKFTQDVMSDTYGIPAGTLVKRVRDLMKFAESVNEDKFYNTRVQYTDPKSKKKFVGDVVRKDGDEYKVNLGKDGRFEKYILAKAKDLKIVSKSKKRTYEAIGKPTISKPFKSNDRTFDKVYDTFDKKDYFNSKGLAKVQIGNFERALKKNDKGAQQVLDMFKGDEKKAKDYITQVISDRNKERAFNNYKALKSAVDSIQKGKPIYGAVDLVKSRIHNNSQKYTMALYSALRNQKFNKWKDIHADVDFLIGESVNEARLGKVAMLKDVEKGRTSSVEGVKISKDLAFEMRMFLQRPMLSRSRTGIAIDNSQMKEAIPMLAKVGIHKRLSSGVKKEFIELLKSI